MFADMLDKAARISEANFGNIFRWDGNALRLVATHNTPPAFTANRRRCHFVRTRKSYWRHVEGEGAGAFPAR